MATIKILEDTKTLVEIMQYQYVNQVEGDIEYDKVTQIKHFWVF